MELDLNPSRTGGLTHVTDKLGICASALCLVHCLFTPILLSCSAVLAHWLPGEASTHRTLAVIVALLGAVSLATGYRRHRQASILALMAAGLACIFFAAYAGDYLPARWNEVAITMCGSVLIICAHRKNRKLCRSCVACTADEPCAA
jgi:uncharacterized membrane protein YfcA